MLRRNLPCSICDARLPLPRVAPGMLVTDSCAFLAHTLAKDKTSGSVSGPVSLSVPCVTYGQTVPSADTTSPPAGRKALLFELQP
jgi:hypothetical protein